MSRFIKVASASELGPGSSKKIELNGKEIALFNVEGSFYAIDDMCPHRGGSLSEGFIESGVVSCPWHGWQFQLNSGECLTDPGICQTKYEVKVEGNDVLINV